MPYREALARRICRSVAGHDVTSSSLGFIVQRQMWVESDQTKGADRPTVSVGSAAHPAALRLEHATPMDVTGKPMKGFFFVAAANPASPCEVTAWTQRALAFVPERLSRPLDALKITQPP